MPHLLAIRKSFTDYMEQDSEVEKKKYETLQIRKKE